MQLFKQKYLNNIQKNNLFDKQIPNQIIFEIFQQKWNSIKYEYTKLLELQLNVTDILKNALYFHYILFIYDFFKFELHQIYFPLTVINEIPLQCLPIIF